MKNVTLTLTVLVLSLCSCNMANHYAGKRIGHSSLSGPGEIQPLPGTPEQELPAAHCNDTVDLPPSSVQPEKLHSETKHLIILNQNKTKKKPGTFIGPQKPAKKIVLKKVRKKLFHHTVKIPLAQHHETKGSFLLTVGLVVLLIGLVIGIVIGLASGSAIAGILAGVGIVILGVVVVVFCLAMLVSLLFDAIFKIGSSR